jgi:hypothetical protein
MDWIALTGTITGVAGVSFGIFQAIRSRQLSRHAIKLQIGVLSEREFLNRRMRRRINNTLLFGIPHLSKKQVVLSCVYRLQNAGKLPLSDITIELQYPHEYLLDDSILIDEENETATVITTLRTQEREVISVDDMALVRYKFNLLRPGETLMFPDMLKLIRVDNKSKETSSDLPVERLNVRMKDIPSYFAACEIHATVWSSNCLPIAKEINVLCFGINGLKPDEEMEQILEKFADAIWDGKQPKPGLYFHLPWKRKRFSFELCELIVPPDGKDPLTQTEVGTNVFNANRSLVEFRMPPWGLHGESFDLESYLGKRII